MAEAVSWRYVTGASISVLGATTYSFSQQQGHGQPPRTLLGVIALLMLASTMVLVEQQTEFMTVAHHRQQRPDLARPGAVLALL